MLFGSLCYFLVESKHSFSYLYIWYVITFFISRLLIVAHNLHENYLKDIFEIVEIV